MAYKFNAGKTIEVLDRTEEEYKEWKKKDLTNAQFAMIQRLTSLEGKKVLDFGCFHGMLTEMINKKTQAKCTGVDINFLGEIPENCMLYDGKNLPFKDQSFDIALMIEVVEHLEDINGILNEVCRILKPGGEVILTTANKYSVSLWKKDHRHWKNQIKQILKLQTRECIKLYSFSELKKLGEKHGFSCESYGRLKRFPFLRRGFILKLTKR